METVAEDIALPKLKSVRLTNLVTLTVVTEKEFVT